MTLLAADVLVMDQVRAFLRDDFAIRDADGRQVGSILTEGSALTRFFTGPRQLVVVDEAGSPVVRLDDVMTFGRDRFELADGAGRPLGSLVKELSFFRQRFTVELVTGEVLDLQGSFFERDFTITGPGGEAARVGRRWPGLTASLLGRDRYVVGFAAGVPAHLHAAVLATVIALDLVLAKEEERRRHQ